MIDGNGQIVTGPVGALPFFSKDPVNTLNPLYLVLMTTVTRNDEHEVFSGNGQINLMRAVVYPPL
jgi:hypothetical protein